MPRHGHRWCHVPYYRCKSKKPHERTSDHISCMCFGPDGWVLKSRLPRLSRCRLSPAGSDRNRKGVSNGFGNFGLDYLSDFGLNRLGKIPEALVGRVKNMGPRLLRLTKSSDIPPGTSSVICSASTFFACAVRTVNRPGACEWVSALGNHRGLRGIHATRLCRAVGTTE